MEPLADMRMPLIYTVTEWEHIFFWSYPSSDPATWNRNAGSTLVIGPVVIGPERTPQENLENSAGTSLKHEDAL